MPALVNILARRAGLEMETTTEPSSLAETALGHSAHSDLDKRVYIPCCTDTSPPGLVEASTIDPWQKSGKYALAWVYFCVIILTIASLIRWWYFWVDKVRTATQKERTEQAVKAVSPDSTDYGFPPLDTGKSTQRFFPQGGSLPDGSLPTQPKEESSVSTSWPINAAIAGFRSVIYRPLPVIRLHKRWRPLTFPPLSVLALIVLALVLTLGYTFIPQPLYWHSIRFGSPPVAVRSGMLAVALLPWIVGLSMKANFITMITGIGHERLNVLHRWAAYLCLLLSLIHTVPFYIQPIYDHEGSRIFNALFRQQNFYIYGTGIAALVPLIFLCVHSLPPLRRRFYELFVMIHVPVSILLLGMLFWHCHNYLTSWHYLFATTAIWVLSYVIRLCYLNWTKPWRMSFLVGEEAAVTLLPENAVKVTVPTQRKWKPGQWVYLRMPGIAIFDNHPFTIASLCSDDFPSAYGEEYRDMVLVFRPFKGFTNKVVESALEHGPWHTYRAFLDGPYGGMRRRLDAFDHVVMIAGGSGITAVVSQLLDLIKRMRDGKAVTKTVQLIWALKRPETMEWFKEELRICKEFAPVDAVHCQFYITAAKRQAAGGGLVSAHTPTRPISTMLHDKVNDVFQNIASNRFSTNSARRHSSLIMAEAQGDPEREKELREEDNDRLRPLPQAHLKTLRRLESEPAPYPDRGIGLGVSTHPEAYDDLPSKEQPHMPPHPTLHEKRRSRGLTLDVASAQQNQDAQLQQLSAMHPPQQQFDFGFPSTPTEFQKNLMRFAFMPAAVKSRKSGWSTEWGRPDIPYQLKEMSKEWTGRRTCVFVCGPPSMRVDASRTVAELQTKVLKGEKDEVFLHAENYAL